MVVGGGKEQRYGLSALGGERKWSLSSQADWEQRVEACNQEELAENLAVVAFGQAAGALIQQVFLRPYVSLGTSKRWLRPLGLPP